MMRNLKIALVVLLVSISISACKKDKVEADTTYPEIDLSIANAFPIQCSEILRGQKFTFRARFTDNQELGAYSLDIHNNFDQHSHSTEVSNCTPEAVKKPINPFLLVKTATIPTGLKEYVATAEIDVPSNVDPGDYHFLIRLTDKQGWQTIKGISIKIK